MSALERTGRGSLSAMLACCAAIAGLLAFTASASAATNCGPPETLNGTCFAGGDGNQTDGPGDLVDWQSYASLAPLVDPPKGGDTKFSGGDKELNPGGWDFITGNNTPKTDILDGWRAFDRGFLYASFVRVKATGDTYLGFELNQLGAGPRVSGGIPVPHRSTGDVLITYDVLTTNKISIGMCTWSGDENSGQWLRLNGTPVASNVKTCTKLDPTTVPGAQGGVNFGTSIANYLTGLGPTIGAGRFGEAAVDLNGLPGGAGRFLTDPCGPNGWFWMHSRSSDTVTSQPKDILAGGPITSPTCGLTIDKKVSLNGAPGTFVDSDAQNALAAEVGDTVTYAITVRNTGTAALTVDVSDPLCDPGSLTGPGSRDGSGDPLAAGESVTYTCTHLLTAGDAPSLVNTACTTGTATLGTASTTLGVPPNAPICDSVVVDVFQPGSLAKVTGSKFQDTNGNASHDADEGPLSGFVFYVDYNDNSQFDGGEPAAVSDAGGGWQIAGIKPGAWNVREVSDPGFTCTAPNPCVIGVSLAAGQAPAIGEFGNQPVSTPANQAPGQTPGQIVLGERIGPGAARLLGPTGCTSRVFHARVRGTRIARVVFYLDGRKVKILTRVNFHRTFALRVDPARLRLGVHRLIVKVTFKRGTGTKAKKYRLSFQRCPRALRAPRFTG